MKHIDAIRRSPDTRWDGQAIASLRIKLSQEEIDRVQREAARLREAESKAKAAAGGAGAAPAPGKN